MVSGWLGWFCILSECPRVQYPALLLPPPPTKAHSSRQRGWLKWLGPGSQVGREDWVPAVPSAPPEAHPRSVRASERMNQQKVPLLSSLPLRINIFYCLWKRELKANKKKINWSSFDHKKVLIGFEFHKKSNSSKHKIYLIKIFLKYNVIKVNTTDTYTILIIYKI